MSLEHMSAGNTRNPTAESHVHAPPHDWDAVSVPGSEAHEPHAAWESAWIDIGGEG